MAKGELLLPTNKKRRQHRSYRRLSMLEVLATSEALAAVEAFVTGAVADGHMAAIRAGRSVLLEMRH